MNMLSISDVVARLGISRVHLWEMRKAGEFIPEIHPSPGRVIFREEDFEAWIVSRTTKPAS